MIEAEPASGTAVDYCTPPRLVAEHRLEIRADALEALERAALAGAEVVLLDLGETTEIDASGLGILLLVQKRARERGMRTRLVRVPAAIEQLLDATRLHPLFDVRRQ